MARAYPRRLYDASRAHREPRPPRHRAAVRARARRRRRRRHARVRPPRARARRAPTSRATCCRRAWTRRRSTPPCASAPRAARRSTSSTSDVLAELEPDLIVTQELCPVCAVSYDEVAEVAKQLPTCPEVIALDPKTFGETMGDVRTIAQATGAAAAALDLVARQRARVDAVRIAVRGARARARSSRSSGSTRSSSRGHWTPQLIEMAGGDRRARPRRRAVRAGRAGRRSPPPQPEVVVVMPCGYDAARALQEAETYADRLRALGARRVVAIDASATFSRPGPAARRRARDARPRPAPRPRPRRRAGPEAPGPALDVL